MTVLRQTVVPALIALFLALAVLHVYWAFGGRLGASVAVPEVDGRPLFRPSRAATLTVACLLGAGATIVGLRSHSVSGPDSSRRFVHLGTWILSGVFALRAVGNFDTVGLFKIARATAFARYDTRLFTPLCLAISLGCLVVALGR
jgi:uncharacterized protein DUF3995